MNLMIVISGISYTVLAFIIGIIFIFFTLTFLKMIHKNMLIHKGFGNNNIALSLYISSSIFAVAWVMKGAIEPAITALNLVIRNPSSVFINYLKIFGIMLFQLVVPGIFAFAFILTGLWIFEKLTRDIQEMEEIQKNNIALGILLSTIIIILVLFIQPGIEMIMSGLIPFPEVGIN